MLSWYANALYLLEASFSKARFMNGEKYCNFIIGTHFFLLSRLAQHTDEHVNIRSKVPLRQQPPRQT